MILFDLPIGFRRALSSSTGQSARRFSLPGLLAVRPVGSGRDGEARHRHGPDFGSAANRQRFEFRALFLLASWRRLAACARPYCRLHLACIGEPPRSVRALAEECGAVVSTHLPVDRDRPNCNKFERLRSRSRRRSAAARRLGRALPLGPVGSRRRQVGLLRCRRRLSPDSELLLGEDLPSARATSPG